MPDTITLNRAQRRMKPRPCRQRKWEPPMLIKLHATLAPIETLLDDIERTGYTDAERGVPVFQPAGTSNWFQVAPAIFGLAEIFDQWAREHNTGLPTDPLKRFARKLAASMPVTLDDVAQARVAVNSLKRVPMTREEGYRLVQDCQIRDELERSHG